MEVSGRGRDGKNECDEGIVEGVSSGLHLSMRKQFTRSCYLYTVIKSVWHGLCLANSFGDTELTAEVIFFDVRPPTIGTRITLPS